MPKQAAKLEVK